jgi:hypothetical protein
MGKQHLDFLALAAGGDPFSSAFATPVDCIAAAEG